ncbi:DUF2793 domain-containing protein [Phycobacter azelaicus]|uniref:DUF2793 domain-containing protein n=1 Tax=Phycobacter azelaicus TaxID=2668075 RepID=UPI0018663863|nr:DUF2793 domain-containing protein [Phycobacter azelaicus]
MSDRSPALSLPLLMPSQAQKHVTHNEALMRLDMLVQLAVLSADQPAPPSQPGLGERHIVGAGASGDWAGHAREIALWDGMIWLFVPASPGWRADVVPTGQSLRFDGTDWQPALPVLQNLPALGIGAAADAANPLSVAGPATLFSHAGAGHQLKLNKSGAGDTASLLFQTGWSGRAEMGTAGTDDFSIKVSSDGSSWHTALEIDRSDGRIRFPKGSPDLRARLDAARLYHVRPDGSDANDGLSDTPGGAFATVQKAINTALTLDNGPNSVAIALAPGSYGEAVVIDRPLIGSGPLQITGNAGAPASVSLDRVTCRDGAHVRLEGVALVAADALRAEAGARVELADLHLIGSGTGLHLDSAEITCSGTDLFLGSALTGLANLRGHARLRASGSSFTLGTGITWTSGALDLSGFCHADLTGVVFAGDTAGCAGPRYLLAQGAILDSGGAGGSFVPGSTPGTSSSGAQSL